MDHGPHDRPSMSRRCSAPRVSCRTVLADEHRGAGGDRAHAIDARLTPNRPDKRNALSLDLMQELLTMLRRVSADPDTRAIVLTTRVSPPQE